MYVRTQHCSGRFVGCPWDITGWCACQPCFHWKNLEKWRPAMAPSPCTIASKFLPSACYFIFKISKRLSHSNMLQLHRLHWAALQGRQVKPPSFRTMKPGMGFYSQGICLCSIRSQRLFSGVLSACRIRSVTHNILLNCKYGMENAKVSRWSPAWVRKPLSRKSWNPLPKGYLQICGKAQQ